MTPSCVQWTMRIGQPGDKLQWPNSSWGGSRNLGYWTSLELGAVGDDLVLVCSSVRHPICSRSHEKDVFVLTSDRRQRIYNVINCSSCLLPCIFYFSIFHSCTVISHLEFGSYEGLIQCMELFELNHLSGIILKVLCLKESYQQCIYNTLWSFGAYQSLKSFM